MKIKHGIVVLFLLATELHAQDSLVVWKDLRFTTDVEKQLFDDLMHGGNVDEFSLMLAGNSRANATFINNSRNRFTGQVGRLQALSAKQKRNDKRIKALYDDIHKTFFLKYEEVNHFSDVFVAGLYNCVSATAMYAFYFETLGIPYQIKEMPTHVYLIAYPSSDQLRVESTSPVNGVETLNTSFKQGFVKMMKDQKMISNQEYVANSVDHLFDKYYFGENRTISLKELAGIQYMNDALYKHDDGKHKEAFEQMQKAYLLFRTGAPDT